MSNNRGKTVQGRGGHEEEGTKSRKTVQIFVKVDGSKEFPMDVLLSDKVGDITKRIPNNACCSRRVT